MFTFRLLKTWKTKHFGLKARTRASAFRRGSKNRDSGLFRKAPAAGFGQNFVQPGDGFSRDLGGAI